ncbi:inositol monophosphatase [Frigidibacter sp. SD6-1]|uniref:inositol monophosphatase family protein n=1 Tax=Frigidibacter sp. SD6-1 TaxID=3032581 RepID=UPI0024DF3C0C|nr:inositol monophosphatase [Frigidibacter sp. SD6-1]
MTIAETALGATDLSTLADIIDEAGRLAMGFFEDQHARTVTVKSPLDYVSDADHAVEQFIRDRLMIEFPGVPVIGEELGGNPSRRYWSVDPIDGTANFLSGLPFWAISIGLVEDGVPVAGSVHAPALRISASGSAGQGLCSTGLSAKSAPARPNCFAVGRNSAWTSRDRCATEDRVTSEGYNIVGYGSCALSLMLVAAGRLGGYIERSVSGMWDCAGGAALCKAAGVKVRLDVEPGGAVDVEARLTPLFEPTV